MQQDIKEAIISLRHSLHMQPCLSGREQETKQLLMDFLKENTTLTLTDMGAWFYATYHCRQTDLPPIAIRADMDALPMEEGIPIPHASRIPGVSHKCGHDGHSAALCGLALLLEKNGAGRDVFLVFQHAEETGQGGSTCADVLKGLGISEVYACHNWSGFPEGQVLVKSGTAMCGSVGMTFCFKGMPTHASQPEKGRNPASAISRLALYFDDLTRKVRAEGSLTMATIVHLDAGSRNFGMAAANGSLSATLRAETTAGLEKLCSDSIRMAEQLAQDDGLELSISESDRFPATCCHEDAVRKVRSAALSCGLEVRPLDVPFRSSEDFGYYTEEIPGTIFFIGNGTDYPAIHTTEYDFVDANLMRIACLFHALCL